MRSHGERKRLSRTDVEKQIAKTLSERRGVDVSPEEAQAWVIGQHTQQNQPIARIARELGLQTHQVRSIVPPSQRRGREFNSFGISEDPEKREAQFGRIREGRKRKIQTKHEEAFGKEYRDLRRWVEVEHKTPEEIVQILAQQGIHYAPGSIFQLTRKLGFENRFRRGPQLKDKPEFRELIQDVEMKPYFELSYLLAGVADDPVRQQIVLRICGLPNNTLESIAATTASHTSWGGYSRERIRQIEKQMIGIFYDVKAIKDAKEKNAN